MLKVAMYLPNEYGGVNQHKIAINKYSSHKIKFIPPKPIRVVLNKIELFNFLFQKYIKNFNQEALNKGRSSDFLNLMYKKFINKIGQSFLDAEMQRYDPINILYRRLMNRVGLSRYNVIHSHESSWFINLCYAAARKGSCKWVHTYHTLHFGEDFTVEPLKFHEEIQDDSNKTFLDIGSKADEKISVSNWLHDYLLKKHAIKTKIIPNGVEFDKCKRASSLRFIKKFGVRNFILYVGNIRTIKNPGLFIKLSKQLPKIKFVMIGRQLNAFNIKKILNSSLPNNVILLGEMKHSDVLDAMAACKTFVMTSKSEGFPTVLLEAMSVGKPVVVPSHTGCKEIVKNEKYGYLYNLDSFHDLVEKTELALTDNHIGENAREMISENYDWKILTKKIDLLYDS